MQIGWIDCYGVVRIRETQLYADEKKVFILTEEEWKEKSSTPENAAGI